MTRRHLLAGLSLPFLPLPAAFANRSGITTLTESHLLSRESAAAFSAFLAQFPRARRPLILLPGNKQLSPSRAMMLRRSLESGASIIIECGLAFATPAEINRQRHILNRAFGIRLGDPISAPPDSHHPYITFAGTSRHLVRPFGFTFPVFSSHGQSIARLGESSVGFKTQAGKGTIVFLGTMIGPHLLASDPDAQCAVTNLLTDLNC